MTAELPNQHRETTLDAMPTETRIETIISPFEFEKYLTPDDTVRYRCTQAGVDYVGEGRSAPEAAARYAELVGDFEPRTNATVVDPAEVDDGE
jgi:hypothetical protein